MATSVQDDQNMLESIQKIVQEALRKLGYSDEYYELLKVPMMVLTVRIPVRMDDGTTRVFTAYRARHNDAAGPTSGGVRFHPKVTEAQIMAMSIWTGMKYGMLDLPFGGASGGVVCDPRGMSFGELERLSRGYVRAISRFVEPHEDILTPSILTNSQTMAWMADEYNRIRASGGRMSVTGKPLVLGGTRGRETAVPKGGAILLEEAAKRQGLSLKGARVIIQGFEHAGSDLARIMEEAGAIVVGISDPYGALYNPDGLDIGYLLDNRDSFGAVTNLFRNTIPAQELLLKPCDILVPAVAKHQIHAGNARKIQAKIVLEGGSNLIDEEGLRILAERGVLVVPDILALSGGSVLSYIEWMQNRQGWQWTEEEVEAKMREILASAFQQVCEMAQSRNADMRLAAHMTGLRKYANAMHLRGWV